MVMLTTRVRFKVRFKVRVRVRKQAVNQLSAELGLQNLELQ